MIELTVRGSTLVIEGDLERADIEVLQTQLPALLPGIFAIDCHALDIEDGAALACLARFLKDAGDIRHLTIHGAPQLLAHTLYRVAALGHFSFPDLRWEEASTQ